MLNLLSPPPNFVTINGKNYPIHWDFKVWLDITELLEDFSLANDDTERFKTLLEIIGKAFDVIPSEPATDILSALQTFAQGYPHSETDDVADSGESSEEPLFSFQEDINLIIIAIRNQSGIDLSYRRKEPFHWWEFLLEFQSLEETHKISKIIGYRGYDGDDKNMLKVKERYALPRKMTAAEKDELDKFNKLFQ